MLGAEPADAPAAGFAPTLTDGLLPALATGAASAAFSAAFFASRI